MKTKKVMKTKKLHVSACIGNHQVSTPIKIYRLFLIVVET